MHAFLSMVGEFCEHMPCEHVGTRVLCSGAPALVCLCGALWKYCVSVSNVGLLTLLLRGRGMRGGSSLSCFLYGSEGPKSEHHLFYW